MNPDAATPLCPKCGERGCRENGSCPAERSAAIRPERAKFEETKHPQDFLRWLNAYTNERRDGDDELHALCSWAHSVISALSLEGAP